MLVDDVGSIEELIRFDAHSDRRGVSIRSCARRTTVGWHRRRMSRFTEEQIIKVLKEHAGRVPDVQIRTFQTCRPLR
jgi:hypothetical protein